MFWQLWAFIVAPLCVVVGAALLLLFLMNARQDLVSRSFIGAIAAITLCGLFGCFTVFLSRLGINITFAAEAALVALCPLPLCLTVFTLAYFDEWTPQQKPIAYLMFVHVVITAIAMPAQLLIYDAVIEPDGSLVSAAHDPLSVSLLMIWVLFSFVPVALLFSRYRNKLQQIHWSVVAGMIVLTIGCLALGNRELVRLSIGPIALTVGLLLIARPVLRERLFDPLVRMNEKLERYTHELDAVFQLGQRTMSTLGLPRRKRGIMRDLRVNDLL